MHALRPTSFLMCLLLALAACGDKPAATTQAAARVNQGEITVHQVSQALQAQRGLTPEQIPAASKEALERLVTQELAVQKATELQLDRQPRVLAALEAARREILAKAYAEQVAATVPKPSAQDVRQFYQDKPALFSARRIYTLQEFNIQGFVDSPEAVEAKVTPLRSAAAITSALAEMGLRVHINQNTVSAERMPMGLLDRLASLAAGQSVVLTQPGAAKIIHIAAVQEAPVELDQARAPIETFLLNQRRQQAVEAAMKSARSTAKIDYLGQFAGPAASGVAAASAPASALPMPLATPSFAEPSPPPAADGSDLDSATIKKGMGFK